MTTTVVTTKGQVVIPAKLRHRFNLKKGTKIGVEARGDELILKPVTAEYFDKIAGILPTKGKLTKLLLEERANEREREERR